MPQDSPTGADPLRRFAPGWTEKTFECPNFTAKRIQMNRRASVRTEPANPLHLGERVMVKGGDDDTVRKTRLLKQIGQFRSSLVPDGAVLDLDIEHHPVSGPRNHFIERRISTKPSSAIRLL